MQKTIGLILLSLLPIIALGQEFNAGIVQGLWYSEPEVFAEQPVRIYVAIRNNTGGDLTGRVEFLDNDTLVARQQVSALNGRIIESWADWEPSYGSHTITALLSRLELTEVGSSTKTVNVTSAVAEDVIFVDYDTDGDGIGNKEDIDDDGDGLTDEEEEAAGSDPLTYDEPEEPTTAVDESQDDQNDAAEEKTDGDTSGSDFPEGLEQYLTPSPARTALTNLSQFAENSKRNIDAYRQGRRTTEDETPEILEITVDDSGFGEITRTSSSQPKVVERDTTESGFFTVLFSVVGTIFNGLYGLILSILSLYFSHPLFLQLSLLLLLLFAIYKIARKIGERPK